MPFEALEVRLIWLSAILRQGRRDEALRLHGETLKKHPRLAGASTQLFDAAAGSAQERLGADIDWLRDAAKTGVAVAR